MMIRKRELEILLERVVAHPKPKVWLEQYTIPSRTAAEILFIASHVHSDIHDRSVADLGCGTGRLAIGAGIIGAREVAAVDIDPVAIQTAKKNAATLKAQDAIHWINSDIEAVRGPFDTVLMNPPFGTRTKHADTRFLTKALSTANSVYSLHKRSTRHYLLKFVEDDLGRIEALYEMTIQIPRTYSFHIKKSYNVNVDLYIIRSRRLRR